MVGSLTAVGKSMGPRPATSDLKLGADDERGPLAQEIFTEAEVEGVGRVVQNQDGAGPAEHVEARVVGGPQGDTSFHALGLGGDERAAAVGRAGDGRLPADEAVHQFIR